MQDAVVRMLNKSDIQVNYRHKWERFLSKFCQTYSTTDAEDILQFGFKNLKTSVKLRILKELCEYQFEQNSSFKKAVNEMTPEKQRCKPFVEDKSGHLFWTMTDANDDAVVYKEHLKKQSWNVLAHDREELTELIKKNAPPSPPRRTSTRRPSILLNESRSQRKAKDLLKEFRVSLEQ